MEGKTFKTPVKRIHSCWTCNKSPTGHVRPLKNVAVKAIYTSLLEILNISAGEPSIESLYMCDTCLKTIEKVSAMKKIFEENLQQKSECLDQERAKRLIVHSTSTTMKKMKDAGKASASCSATLVKSKKQLFDNHGEEHAEPSSLLLLNDQNCLDAVVLGIGLGDHSYTSQSTELPVAEIYTERKQKMLNTKHAVLKKTEHEKIQDSLDKGEVENVLQSLLSIHDVKDRLWQLMLLDVSSELECVASTKERSVLYYIRR